MNKISSCICNFKSPAWGESVILPQCNVFMVIEIIWFPSGSGGSKRPSWRQRRGCFISWGARSLFICRCRRYRSRWWVRIRHIDRLKLEGCSSSLVNCTQTLNQKIFIDSPWTRKQTYESMFNQVSLQNFKPIRWTTTNDTNKLVWGREYIEGCIHKSWHKIPNGYNCMCFKKRGRDESYPPRKQRWLISERCMWSDTIGR